jgi:uncharacterized protein (UPF0335 family)
MENAPDLVMTNPTAGLDSQQLLSFVQRIEKLNEDKAAIEADLKEVLDEAKSVGFDKKYVKEIVKLRKLDSDELDEQDELMAMYRRAAGL